MVSLITEGSAVDQDGKPFPRRRSLGWVALVAVAAVAAVGVWTTVLVSSTGGTEAMTCTSPVQPGQVRADGSKQPEVGERVGASALDEVQPAPLAASKIRVYNATSERGKAADVASTLSALGFSSAPDVQVANDPLYVGQVMDCFGQIRFGEQGRAVAAALQLAAPCAELIQDKRPDDIVDLSIGSLFHEVSPNTDAEEILRTLKDQAPNTDPKPLDSALLEAARVGEC